MAWPPSAPPTARQLFIYPSIPAYIAAAFYDLNWALHFFQLWWANGKIRSRSNIILTDRCLNGLTKVSVAFLLSWWLMLTVRFQWIKKFLLLMLDDEFLSARRPLEATIYTEPKEIGSWVGRRKLLTSWLTLVLWWLFQFFAGIWMGQWQQGSHQNESKETCLFFLIAFIR